MYLVRVFGWLLYFREFSVLIDWVGGLVYFGVELIWEWRFYGIFCGEEKFERVELGRELVSLWCGVDDRLLEFGKFWDKIFLRLKIESWNWKFGK